MRVYAGGPNRAELRSRAGPVPSSPEFNIWIVECHEDTPKILAEDFVGKVEEPCSATSFKKGEKPAGWIYGGGKAHDGS